MDRRVLIGAGIFLVVLLGVLFLPRVITGNVVVDYCDKDFCLNEGNNDTSVDLYVSSINYDTFPTDLPMFNPGEFFVEPVIKGIEGDKNFTNRVYLVNSKGYLTGECEFVYPIKKGCYLSGLISADYYTVEVKIDVENSFDEKYKDNNVFRESFYFGPKTIAFSNFEESIKETSFEGQFCSGCYVNDRCIPLGYYDSGLFCSKRGIKKQFGVGQKCEFDFECFSLNCVEGKCK